jgi:hypothetical protein
VDIFLEVAVPITGVVDKTGKFSGILWYLISSMFRAVRINTVKLWYLF